MALDARRRQKKVERRHAKQKVKKKVLATRVPHSLAARMEWAAASPLLRCCTSQALWDGGIAPVLLSRKLSDRRVAIATFLVDAYCLGVKDAMSNVIPRSEYDWKLFGRIFGNHEVVELTPEFARKLVEGAVDYAADLGLPPHPDYRTAKLLFGSIDVSACTEEFTFGKDGKPFFFAGPNDNMAHCRKIINILTERCGPNGFESVLPISPGAMLLSGDR